ncbi:MAG: hypothetical protein A3B91_00775 [Candidatus Yanofskybacteria bacterium RIFCSPHIGHO2_02_FULL_41_29]|uniref:Uncharacterized protein n=1 Tax=Candidatus Yanofskybacteria bacterium RIFCSPHIGHO2_01_FULL_41_53 TaxID=1802663 RepID=A0A1F8EJR7_9BACT|nr:MAG: hypothetical protein A2650_00345 [Candidatus Yanofskybacteria bacterium RIFCSPHIGHO2_01_FULL_41_53]OGN12276.1 MAG: hypothetical protein A3B91_00775 [Candidatus Yanofskybacteria bacterium RIFCSPHIGHO2_02_FULL_41_29]OGN17013.1 MAG: hypothetical protein A3F48_03645 [Candidatus Yanofskybacteria bacterium RIFCSPHIGHO2_12_FULL_41_9]OGN23625.1 MAG: hypothetical protein A2916_01540 [Candidatus Yanofskybacteria bacterium RIFCSPLOWO2_01_FULL_41_67]OGN29388.1 MAG: hypothetical protein A3H54_03985 
MELRRPPRKRGDCYAPPPARYAEAKARRVKTGGKGEKVRKELGRNYSPPSSIFLIQIQDIDEGNKPENIILGTG